MGQHGGPSGIQHREVNFKLGKSIQCKNGIEPPGLTKVFQSKERGEESALFRDCTGGGRLKKTEGCC